MLSHNKLLRFTLLSGKRLKIHRQPQVESSACQ
jgi:hypothetical protein